jgi:hypothetical protein
MPPLLVRSCTVGKRRYVLSALPNDKSPKKFVHLHYTFLNSEERACLPAFPIMGTDRAWCPPRRFDCNPSRRIETLRKSCLVLVLLGGGVELHLLVLLPVSPILSSCLVRPGDRTHPHSISTALLLLLRVMTTGGNDHHAASAERQSLLSRIGGVIASRTHSSSSSVTTTTHASHAASSSGGYGGTRHGGCDEESARKQPPPFRMPFGYHMSMTHGSSLTQRTADVGCYDDDDDDNSDNDSQADQDEEDESHEIGYLGSYAIAINSLAGPAVLQLPFQYQQSGFVATTVALLGVAIVSVACSMYICRVVQAIPSTAKLERPVELSTVVDYFWSRKVRHPCVFACINEMTPRALPHQMLPFSFLRRTW